MDKIDTIMVLFGIFSYFSIMYEFRQKEQRISRYADIVEKRRKYSEFLLEKRKNERMKQLAEEKRKRRQEELDKASKAVDTLASFETEKFMRESRITAGKLDL